MSNRQPNKTHLNRLFARNGTSKRMLWPSFIFPTMILALATCICFHVWTTPAEAKPEGKVVFGIHKTLPSGWVDPGSALSAIDPYAILYLVHDAMIKAMPDDPMAPCLAESWTISKDGLTYEFKLREGLKFHNGDPFTAEDVKFSFVRYKGGGATILKQKVKSVEIVDKYRVRFHLKEVWPDFLAFYGTYATGAGWIVPKTYVEKVGDKEFINKPVGLGPYKLVKVEPGVEMVFEAFEDYWRKMPNVKTIVYKMIPDASTRLAMLKRGEIDISQKMLGAVGEEVERDPNLRLVPSGGMSTWWIEFPQKFNPKSPWYKKKVREAVCYAIDKQAICDAITLGASKPWGSIIPKMLEFSLEFEPYPYDPAKAKALLDEAGYPSGFDGGYIYPIPAYPEIGEAIATNLAAIGIKLKVGTMEIGTFFQKWAAKEFKDLLTGSNSSAGNAATRIQTFAIKGGSHCYGSYADLDELFEKQSKETDIKKRREMLYEIQTRIRERVMFGPIFVYYWLTGVGPKVEESGYGLIPGYMYAAPAEEIKLKK